MRVIDSAGRAVVVTGGTTGIGAGIAPAFLVAGAQVLVCGRTEPPAAAAAHFGDAGAMAAAGATIPMGRMAVPAMSRTPACTWPRRWPPSSLARGPVYAHSG